MTTKNQQTDSRIPVLIVDDDDADYFLVKETFQSSVWPVEVSRAKDGLEALEYLSSLLEHRRVLPRIIVLDLNMPRMSGHEFLRIVKQDQELRQIPVVVLSTSASECDVSKSQSLSASRHIRKPNDINEYSTVVDIICTHCAQLAHGI